MRTTPSPSETPIGVFDSGVGGLTVLHALSQALPHEPLLYLGDTARVPYGTRSAAVVRRYATECAQFLVAQGAKLVVIACNTASAYAFESLSVALNVPVIGVIEAGVEAVAREHTSGPVGVLGTRGTIASGAYQEKLRNVPKVSGVLAQPAPLWVPLCEEGLFDHAASRLLIQSDIAPLIAAEVRTVLLGCTHYPLLLPLLHELFGPDVALIDSAQAAARAVTQKLSETGLGQAPRAGMAPRRVCATDVHPRIEQLAAQFLGEQISVEPVVLGDFE